MRVLMLVAAMLAALITQGGVARAEEAAAWQALREGAIGLIRHARAPGTGDPEGFRLDDCATQRNLSDEGRNQAKHLGEAIRAAGVTVAAAPHSLWCRTRETAELAFPGVTRPEPALNSFFADRSTEPEQTAAASRIIRDWRGPGALMLVTHQVNITALTDIVPKEGEIIVVRVEGDAIRVVGRLFP